MLAVAWFPMLIASVRALEVVSIDSYGAVANDSSVAAAVKNSRAIADALQKAAIGYAVLVPQYSRYYTFSSVVTDMEDGVQLWLEGELIAHSNITAWPYDGDDYQHILEIQNCNNFVLTGKSTGVIRGQGYKWWVYTLFNFIHRIRPNMVVMLNCTNVTVESLRVYNSPRYHFYLRNMTNLIVRDIYIWVNVSAQKDLLEQKRAIRVSSSSPWKIPMFPFNTDGIDPSGRNILIHNITVENYDDVVAVKPDRLLTDGCTQNVTVENVRVIL